MCYRSNLIFIIRLLLHLGCLIRKIYIVFIPNKKWFIGIISIDHIFVTDIDVLIVNTGYHKNQLAQNLSRMGVF